MHVFFTYFYAFMFVGKYVLYICVRHVCMYVCVS